MPAIPPTLHATAVAIRGRGVLLTGPSGSGKSDLALRLIDRGAVLVADDRVVVARDAGRVLASPPPALAGLIEVRGLGIIAVPFAERVPVALILDLAAAPERLPPPATRDVAGVAVPVLAFAPFAASAAIRAERALTAFGGGVET
ncbi:MAG: aldolase [Sphingomonadaceae bacterium]|nr:aldolase [Sphingomonadaceae bacterium]